MVWRSQDSWTAQDSVGPRYCIGASGFRTVPGRGFAAAQDDTGLEEGLRLQLGLGDGASDGVVR